MRKDYYAILGISQNATPAEIKRAFRQKARQLHPDVNPSPDATRQFQELNNAYRILSSRARRLRYKRTGAPPVHRPAAPIPYPVRPSAPPPVPLSLGRFLAFFFVIPLGAPILLLLLGRAGQNEPLAQIGASLLALMLAGGEVVVGILLTELVRRRGRISSRPDQAKAPPGG